MNVLKNNQLILPSSKYFENYPNSNPYQSDKRSVKSKVILEVLSLAETKSKERKLRTKTLFKIDFTIFKVASNI